MRGSAALRAILADSPSLCTPTFTSQCPSRRCEQSLYLKQVVVENADGVQYCDAFGSKVDIQPLLGEPRHSRPLPRRSAVGTLDGLHDAGAEGARRPSVRARLVSAFVPIVSERRHRTCSKRFKPTAMVRDVSDQRHAGPRRRATRRHSIAASAEFVSASVLRRRVADPHRRRRCRSQWFGPTTPISM